MSERQLMLSPEHVGSGGVPGAVVITADCGHRAWISPDGLMLQLGGGVRTACHDCIDPADISELQELPGSRASIAAMLGSQELADAIVDTARRDPSRAVQQLQGESRRIRRAKAKRRKP